MIEVRKAAERGRSDSDWLQSRHTFSFDTYHDPRHMGFRTLRVINEDRVGPGGGFPLHPHRDMEILTLVVTGELLHRDSLGHEERIAAGEMQRITAGSGIRHSENNPSQDTEVHFLQIWIRPEEPGLAPGYEKGRAKPGDNALRLVASRNGADGSLTVHQDVRLHTGRLQAGRNLQYRLGAGRHAWLQVVSGRLDLNGVPLECGDGAALSGEPALALAARQDATFLLFDLA